ncbi:MAG: hypothetical protein IJX14_02100, partial [Clostridia bacterium]|nr:hypothetical protein [Clostridia bacterium]
MYINWKENRFVHSGKPEKAVVEMTAPAYLENGAETVLDLAQDGRLYRDNRLQVEMDIRQMRDTLFYVKRIWTNTAQEAIQMQTVFRVRTCFVPERYLIPCVNVNGNAFGNGGEPKGMERDGKKWIFGYDRVAVPACTMTENRDFACGLFASGESDASLRSSCSIWKEDGNWYQEIFHPVIESPVTYAYRDDYGPAYETFITLQPGETFAEGIYLSVSRPRWENYGICDVLDAALDIVGDNGDLTVPENRAVWDRSIVFAKSLITDYEGKKGFIIGFLPDGNGGFAYRGDRCFELAWCGQNILFSRMLVEDYIRFGHRDSLDAALEILDTRAALCTAKNGLLAAQLRDYTDLENAAADTCNMGYGAYEYLRVYDRLREIGIDRPAYLAAGKGLCDFFCGHFSEEYGFGKQWRLDGVCLDEGGTIGGFVIPAMAKLYELTGEGQYLDMAERAMEFYMTRDLDRFCCTAGALDTCCVDKETSAPFIMSGVLLYRLTGKEIYKEYAKKAAYYFTSWMFHYQPVYGPEDEITQYHVCVKGLTSVSAQHHHLDMYAGIVVPYLRELAQITGDARWRTRADMMWRAVLQYIGDGELTVHDVVRPVGSQN